MSSVTPSPNTQAVHTYFEEHSKDKQTFGNQKSRYKRLVLEKDAKGLERLTCRTLKWQERLLAKCNLGGFAHRLGYGNANLRDIIKKCPDLYVYDDRLLKLIKRFNNKHKLKPIPIHVYSLLLDLTTLRPKNIFQASKAGELARIEYLVKNGTDLNCKNAEGKTALHLACLHNQPELVKFILENGGDAHAVDAQGRTALIDICNKPSLLTPKALQILIEHTNIDYTVTDKEGKNALQHALLQRNYTIFTYLLDKNVPINLLGDAISKEVLHDLCFHNRVDVFKKLHEHGVNLCPKNINERHVNDAFFFRHYDLAHFFITLMDTSAIEDAMVSVSENLFFRSKEIEQLVLLVAEGAKKNTMEFEAYLDSVVPSKIPQTCKSEILEAHERLKIKYEFL